MTPEQSQKLLDRVKEGCPLPWEIFTTETIEGDPREVKNVRCNDPRYDGHLAYSADYEGTTEIDPDAIELIAAAPDLAELVANLHYEYAVQVIEGGHTWYVNNHKTLTSASWGAVWLPTFNSADALRRECVTELCLQERCAETFVVRKLTTELEVIDPEVVE